MIINCKQLLYHFCKIYPYDLMGCIVSDVFSSLRVSCFSTPYTYIKVTQLRLISSVLLPSQLTKFMWL